jgi:hypothetical protein
MGRARVEYVPSRPRQSVIVGMEACMHATPRRTRGGALRQVLAGAIAVAIVGLSPSPSHAQKLNHEERYWSQEAPIATQSNDPNCTQFPGVYRWSKVWVDTYGLDESWKTQMRMQFHTTYSAAVAVAKVQLDALRWRLSCSDLNTKFKGVGVVDALVQTACWPGLPGRPDRWCDLALNAPSDPMLDLKLQQDRCDDDGVNLWNEWHDLSNGGTNEEARIYNIDVLANLGSFLSQLASSLGVGFRMPVYLDDITIVGGVRNFDQASAQPAYGDRWIGYGHVQTGLAAEVYAQWYDEAARRLGYNPFTNPVRAHNAVDDAIAAGRAPRGTNGWTRAELFGNFICPVTPKIREVLDPNRIATFSAIGQDLSGWVLRETGKTLCQKIRSLPQYAAAADFVCLNAFAGMFFTLVDNDNCMNRPTDPIANTLGVDLGCNRRVHVMRLFKQMKAFLGG